MPAFNKLSRELQRKALEMENYANELGRYSKECTDLWKELGKSEVACFSLGQTDEVFKVCTKAPTEASLKNQKNKRCGTHGGKSPAFDELPEESKLKRMKNLRPKAVVHGLYAEKGSFMESLTDAEMEFMAWLEDSIRNSYEVEEGLGDVILEGALVDAVIHFRLVNTGRFDTGSKHTAKPLMDLQRTCKDMGWTKKSKDSIKKTPSVLGKYLNMLEDAFQEDEEDKELN